MSRPLLITAGATRNPIDAMRVITAGSSGGTGVALAAGLADQRVVHLLGSPEALLRARGLPITTEEYGSTRDLMARMHAWLDLHPEGVVVHACAVGDYEAEASDGKLPSGQPELVLRLRPTPKILDTLRPRAPGIRLVSFKAAPPRTTPGELEQICRRQLERTASDLVFGNVIGALEDSSALVRAADITRFDRRGDALAALTAWLLEASR